MDWILVFFRKYIDLTEKTHICYSWFQKWDLIYITPCVLHWWIPFMRHNSLWFNLYTLCTKEKKWKDIDSFADVPIFSLTWLMTYSALLYHPQKKVKGENQKERKLGRIRENVFVLSLLHGFLILHLQRTRLYSFFWHHFTADL